MKQPRQQSNPLQNIIKLTMLSLCTIFAVILWLELYHPEPINEEIIVVDVDALSRNMAVDNKEYVFPKIVAFDEVIQRPLFNETRLPFVEPEPELKQTVTKPNERSRKKPKKQEQYSLSAVVMTPDKQIAILQSGRGKTLQRVALGEMIDGWSLDEVTSHSVQLKKGEEIKKLELEIKGSNPKPVSKTKAQSRASARRKKEATEKAEILQKQALIEEEGREKQSRSEAAAVDK